MKSKKKKQPELVMVEWVDSAQPVASWHHLSDPPSLEIIECVSVGWAVQESDQVIMLAPNIGNIQSGGAAQACGFIRIPKTAVTRTVRLEEVN